MTAMKLRSNFKVTRSSQVSWALMDLPARCEPRPPADRHCCPLPLQSSSVQTCTVTSRTSTCSSQMLLTAIRSHSFYLRTMKQTPTQSSHMCISHTPPTPCAGRRDCPPNSQRPNTTTTPSISLQTFRAQTPSPKSGPSLTPLCLWMPACSQSTHRVCCHQPGRPHPGTPLTWPSPRQKGSRSLQSPHSENGWTAFSTGLRSSSPKRRRRGKARVNRTPGRASETGRSAAACNPPSHHEQERLCDTTS